MTARLERVTAAGDITAAQALLRASRRAGEVSGVLAACNTLLPAFGTDWIPHVPAVRAALRWAVNNLAVPGVKLWQVQSWAVRIANLARLLPNPQPPKVAATVNPDGTPYSHMIAPTHALRLYIDALRVAKGAGWFEWLGLQWAAWTFTHRPSWVGPEHLPSVKVYEDGTIECGAECPSLPELTP